MKKNLPVIILTVLLIAALSGDVILFKSLSEEKERNETLQATVNELQTTISELQAKNNELNTLHTELAAANETIADLESKVEEITAEMLEGLSAELNEEQQAAAEEDNNGNNGNTGNNNNGGNGGNTGNNGGNTNNQPQQPPQMPDIDLSYFQGDEFVIGEGPVLRQPDNGFGEDVPYHGVIAQ